MNRHRPYHLMNPLTGIWPAYGDALGYRYVSPDGDGLPVTYSVTHSHTDHSSLITAHSSHTFSAKERDVETGLSYFGSRYYSSDLSIWLSVDPMSDKYASLSPYVYCANNPVKLVDPNGEDVWIPGLDEKGNVTYTAEAGDSFESFVSQFDCRDVNGRYRDDKGQYISEKIFNNAKLNKTGNIKEGTVIKGEHVKKATNGSDVLKGNWHNMNDSQKSSQVMFALMYGAHRDLTVNGLPAINLNDFINGFEIPSSGKWFYNVTIPLKGGRMISADINFMSSSAIEDLKGNFPVRTYAEWANLSENPRSTCTANILGAKNPTATHPFKCISFVISKNDYNDFCNSLR